MAARPANAPAPLPSVPAVRRLLFWHQGGLGDLLLAGPALLALHRRYPQAEILAVGHPARWGVMSPSLPIKAVHDSSGSLWSALYLETGPFPPPLGKLLREIDLAVVFTPQERPLFLSRLAEGGVRQVVWIPSFGGTGEEPATSLQACRLSRLGLSSEPQPLRLVPDPQAEIQAEGVLAGAGPWLAVAPGSGHPAKNWPLSHYFEVTRALAWELKLKVVWLAGPAEHTWLPYLAGLAAAEGHVLAAGFTLPLVAAILSRSLLYLGGDSGLTHLAAAAGAKRVLALFGPTSPKVWAPGGAHVKVLTAPADCAPCARGRDIPCPRPDCLAALSPHTVFQAAREFLTSG